MSNKKEMKKGTKIIIIVAVVIFAISLIGSIADGTLKQALNGTYTTTTHSRVNKMQDTSRTSRSTTKTTTTTTTTTPTTTTKEETTDKSETNEKTTEHKYEFVVNTNTGVIHSCPCPNESKISDKNKKTVKMTWDEMLDSGYTPCGTCID